MLGDRRAPVLHSRSTDPSARQRVSLSACCWREDRFAWSAPQSLEQRLADGLRCNIVEEYMRLHQNAHMRSARAVDGNLCLDAKLTVAIYPDHTRIDRAGRLPLASRQRNFYERNEIGERLGQSKVVNVLLQIR